MSRFETAVEMLLKGFLLLVFLATALLLSPVIILAGLIDYIDRGQRNI